MRNVALNILKILDIQVEMSPYQFRAVVDAKKDFTKRVLVKAINPSRSFE